MTFWHHHFVGYPECLGEILDLHSVSLGVDNLALNATGVVELRMALPMFQIKMFLMEGQSCL